MRHCCRVSPSLAHNRTQYLPMAATWFSRHATAMAKISCGWRLWTGARRLGRFPTRMESAVVWAQGRNLLPWDGWLRLPDAARWTERRKVLEQPVQEIKGVSPDGQWIAVYSFDPSKKGEEGKQQAELVYPVSGGPPIRIWGIDSMLRWSPDRKFLFLSRASGDERGSDGEELRISASARPDVAGISARRFPLGTGGGQVPRCACDRSGRYSPWTDNRCLRVLEGDNAAEPVPNSAALGITPYCTGIFTESPAMNPAVKTESQYQPRCLAVTESSLDTRRSRPDSCQRITREWRFRSR